MEITKETAELLEQLPQPVFLVNNRSVVYANHGAQARGIQEGTPIDSLISIGTAEYEQFLTGKLMLTVSVAGIPYNTVVSTMGELHMFCLESEYSNPELRAFALAAQALREPLANALLGIDSLIPEQTVQDSPALLEQIKAINKNMYQLHRAVRNMSDAATIGAVSNKELRDVANLFSEYAEKATVQLAKAGHQLLFQPLNRPAYCYINPEKIERAFLNLISNAVKHAEKPSTVTVSLRIGSSKLYISVESDCKDPQELISSNLFSRFMREPSIHSGRSGVGLGLTIAYGVATAHKGTLLVEQPAQNRIRFTMSISADTSGACAVNSPLVSFDNSGGYDSFLIELSEILPPDLYE